MFRYVTQGLLFYISNQMKRTSSHDHCWLNWFPEKYLKTNILSAYLELYPWTWLMTKMLWLLVMSNLKIFVFCFLKLQTEALIKYVHFTFVVKVFDFKYIHDICNGPSNLHSNSALIFKNILTSDWIISYMWN